MNIKTAGRESNRFISILLVTVCHVSLVSCDVFQFLHPNATTAFKIFTGGTAKFDCRVRNASVRPTVLWYKYGQPLEDITYRRINIRPDPTTWILELSNLLLADAGTYSCIIRYHGNTSKKLERTFDLRVEEIHNNGPIILGASTVNITAKVGHTARFICHANSSSVPYMFWRKTLFNQSKNSSKKFETQLKVMEMITKGAPSRMRAYKGEFVITRVIAGSNAKFTCLVFNQHGQATKDFYFNVLPESGPSLQELQSQYGLQFDSSPPLPFAAIVSVPLVVLIVVAAILLRALERAKQRCVKLEAKQLNSMRNISVFTQMNVRNPGCTCTKEKHLAVPSSRLKRPMAYTVVTSANPTTAPDVPLELSCADKPSISALLADHFPPETTREEGLGISNTQCKSSGEISVEEQPVLNMEAQVNGKVHALEQDMRLCSSPESYQLNSPDDSELDLEWEGIDLTVMTDEAVKLSKEEEV